MGIFKKTSSKKMIKKPKKSKRVKPSRSGKNQLVNSKIDRIQWVIYIVLILYFCIILRLFFMQVICYPYYRQKAISNSVRIQTLLAPRGLIVDTYGRVVADNTIGYRLIYLDGRTTTPQTLQNMSSLLGMDQTSVGKMIKFGDLYKFSNENMIMDDIGPTLAAKILENNFQFPYLTVVEFPKREYLYPVSMSNVLGYVRTLSASDYSRLQNQGYSPFDFIGKAGIEREYDLLLRGRDGEEIMEVNALNQYVKTIDTSKPIQGAELQLGIDANLQKYMYQQMNGHYSAFIAMDAKTGQIITMVSCPSYDSSIMSGRIPTNVWNSYLNNPNDPLQDKCVAGAYATGSVYKAIVALSFLQNGIAPDYQIFDPGYYKVGNRIFHNWYLSGQGWVNMVKALQLSCDTYFYEISVRLGPDAFINLSKEFGLGKPTGVDIPGELPGLLPTQAWKQKTYHEGWYLGDTANLSIGQGYLLTTPIQMLEVYDIIANDGIGYEPHVLQAVYSGNKKYEIVPTISNQVSATPEQWAVVKQGLRAVVTSGTATILNFPKLAVSGKTGTAQNNQFKGLPHSWFCGYFPAGDTQIVFVAFVGGSESAGAMLSEKFVKKYCEEHNIAYQ
ncbi:MAG: penicillin-binding protein 2 [Fusobacteria bacterium]|nr:penicillin-binding protein 2 [Fusobacteriota bacterium]